MRFWNRLTPGRRVADEVSEEIRAHIEERTDDLRDAGVPEAEARRRARIELGSATRAVEDSRAVWVSRFIDQGAREARWVWRGLRARRGRAVLSVALLACALAANVIVFAFTDSLVLNRVPYPNSRALVQIRRARLNGSPNAWVRARALDQWRDQRDLFTSVDGYLTGTVFLLGSDTAEQVRIVGVTIGLFDTLGIAPAFGRGFTEGDDRRLDEQSVLISDSLARRRFGSPSASLDQVINTAAQPLRVVGVMPSAFTFPNGNVDIWRALDPAGPLAAGTGNTVSSVARLRSDLDRKTVNDIVKIRGIAVDAAAGVTDVAETSIAPLEMAQAPKDLSRILAVLSGAAFCLLLTACINVLNLELTGVVGRTRALAIQSALGATRATLIRVALIEGVVLIGLAALLASAAAWLGLSVAMAAMPRWARLGSPNPIDIDIRALVYMLAAAAFAWLIAALPAVVHVSRRDLSRPLTTNDRATAPKRSGARVRQAITIAQVALAVLLVVIGGLYTRTYRRLLTQPKGFDSTNLASVSMALPNRFYPSFADRVALSDAVVARLRALPFVIDAVAGAAPPSTGDTPFGGVAIGVDGRQGDGPPQSVAVTPIDPRYFSVLRVPLRNGRWLVPDDDESAAVVGESFARRYWPAGEAVGHTFQVFLRNGRKLRDRPDYRIVGVFQDYRTADRVSTEPTSLQAFIPEQPPKPAPPATPRTTIDAGGSYGIVNAVVRLDDPGKAVAVLSAVRPIDPRIVMTLDFVDDLYAQQQQPTLFVTRLVGAFAVGSFLIALAGVYGVMSFLVASRTKEIGIRMALGADRRRIGRFVMGASLTLVMIGAAIGLAGALAMSRLIASQLFGVSPSDPATYLTVVAATIATALLATWQPARRAARVDPVTTLRAE